MPFVTHTEGGSWSGGGTEVPNCNLNDRNAITSAFNFMQNTIRAQVAALGGECATLANRLAGKTIASVNVDCLGGSCRAGIFGTAPRDGDSINMCALALPPNVQADTDVTVFHEIVHSCGGGELDSWALENRFYVGRGTINPGGATVNAFCGETSAIGGGLRAGEFVVWNPSTGQVSVKVLSGGSWSSGPTANAGAQVLAPNATYITASC
ncbi:MAG: hypothetical protein OEM81_04535 [Acidimicrobiia bacterium]|nr:hypothetical protein [Acidimicrobiia bacterium]MDH3397082.1 hypothetical protein [Acidimicrobiia bacterium]